MAQDKVDLDGLSASLDELVKAADATDVVSKAYGGVNVESYGHVDERGTTSGGYADTGDVGGLDDMMIGKMQQVLIEGGFSADQISAFMSGEDEGSDEDEKEDEMEGKASFVSHSRPSAKGKMSGKAPGDIETRGANTTSGQTGSLGQPKQVPVPPPPSGKYGKSMDAFRADSDIADAIEISPYLEALTTRTADQLDGIKKSMSEAHGEQSSVNRAMAAGVYQVGQLVKSMAEIVTALDKRLGLVERTPAPAKGSTSQRQALTKAMPGEAGPGGDSLSKSELLNTLSYMNLEKGVKDINGRSTREVIGMFEAGGLLDQGTVDAVHKFLATHPADAKAARTYR